MKYTGRIFTLTVCIIVQSVFLIYYYYVDGYINMFEKVTTPLLFIIAWFIGKQFDKAKFYDQEFKKSQGDLQQILDSVDATIWSFDIHRNTAVVSDGIEKIFGLSHQEFKDNPMALKELVYQKDIKLVNEHMQELFSGKPSQIEYRIIRLDGEIRWIYENSKPIFDSNGKLIKINGVVLDISDRKKAEEKINKLAYYDSLTGLPNRHMLNDYLKKLLARSKRKKQMLGVMFIDLDRFKTINDTMGHSYGDILLKQVSEKLQKCIREGDIIFRYGGDEFIILLEDIEQEGVSHVAQRIIDEFSDKFILNNHEIYSSPSIGISMYPKDGDNLETLLKHADTAMYLAKEQGKNNYQFYTSTLTKKKFLNMKLENGLRKALERNEFLLYYQPQMELGTGKIIGMEALIRWQHPDFGLVPPAEFIPLAEEMGLIVPIGKWVLETACKQNKVWQQAGFPSIYVAVNISPRQLQDEFFIETVRQVLKETELEPQYLELEITESIMKNVEEATLMLNKLKAIEVSISVDDFGTGYSSLSILKDLPVDKIKIDRSFINNLCDSKTIALVKAIIDMGQKLNFNVIAEGIENGHQVSFLKQNKCDIGQGYFFSKPLPSEEMLKNIKFETMEMEDKSLSSQGVVS